MTTSVNASPVNVQILPTLREEFGVTKNRAKVSKISQDAIDAYAKKANVQEGSVFTSTVVEKRRRNTGLGKVEKYVVYVNFQEKPAEVAKDAKKA